MPEKIYLVMREKGIHTDGKTYYEAETSVLGVRSTPDDAGKLLEKVIKKYHPEDKPYQGIYNKELDMNTGHVYKIDEGLTDSFWIRSMIIGPEGDLY